MQLQLRIDPDWRERKGIRPYKFARLTSTGTIRPVRYYGLSRIIGEIIERKGDYVVVNTNETLASFRKGD